MGHMEILGDDGYRKWEDLPAIALVIIFKKLPLKDRLLGGPMVCQSWREVSKNPQCWESMLHDGPASSTYEYSFEYLFIKRKRRTRFDCSPFGRMKVTSKIMKMFVERSKANATTILLPVADEKDAASLLNLITLRCPKLKNLSMRSTHIFKTWSYEVVARLVNLLDRCNELELLDLDIRFCSLGPNPAHPLIINLSPKIRGLRALCLGKSDWLLNFDSIFFMNCRNVELLSLSMTNLRSSDEVEWILDLFGNLKYLQLALCHFSIDGKLKEKWKRKAPALRSIAYLRLPNPFVLIMDLIFMSVCAWFQIEIHR